MSSKIFLIGAGPGPAGLMTVRGTEVLASADVVLFDIRVSAEVAALMPKSAVKISIGDPVSGKKEMLFKALERFAEFKDKNIVVLGGADPFLFGQCFHEAAALKERNISFEVIPGVSVHTSDPAFKGISGGNGALAGKRVVVTRSREQAGKLTGQLQKRGAHVLEVPTIKIVPPTNYQDIADAIVELNSYDWIIFTSANGVTGFFNLFFKGFEDLRDIGGVRIAAVGPATAEKLKELHLKVDVMPAEYVGSKIAEALVAYQSIENLKILIVRAEVANPELPQKLEMLGAIVDDVACYKTVPDTEDLTGDAAVMLEHGADWVLFSSGSTVEYFHARFDLPRLLERHPKMKIASIGPETTKAIRALSLKPAFEAKEHTMEGLIRGLEE